MRFSETVSHLFRPRRSNNHRSRVLHPDSLLTVTGVVAGFGLFILVSGWFNPKLGSILGYASNITVEDIVAQTNAERAKSGLSALSYSPVLSQAAAAKAEDMFAKQYWAHQSPDGVEPWKFIADAGYSYTAAGENLARDFMITPDMIAAWMASPTHAANIMNARYQEIGVAAVNGTLEGIETTLVVQMFGRPAATTAVAQIPSTAGATSQSEVISVEPSAVNPVATPQPVVELEPTPAPDLIQETVLSSMPPTVLAEAAVPLGSLRRSEAVFSPLQLTKAFGLSVLLVIVATLILDWNVSHRHGSVRIVGKNFAHILYFSTMCFVLILFRGGFVF